ncbi:MAG: diaminopimelate dehydrogenase [Bacillota bacterium]
MAKVRVAVVGFGNVGRAALAAVKDSPDMELAGIVIRNPGKLAEVVKEVGDVPVTTDVCQLGDVKVAMLCVASRAIREVAPLYLKLGINTVDSFDVHGQSLLDLRAELNAIARAAGAVAIISAGWDPGTDSVVRAIMEVLAPRGITYTDFGPGMSMGHTVAAKAVDGVVDALSITIPQGMGLHRRLVYVKLKPETRPEEVERAILRDPYFAHDDTRVCVVEDVDSLIDTGHGVKIQRKGVAAGAHNQRMQFKMWVTNPAVTAQVMVCAARASLKQQPGCYTMLEVPVIDFIHGEREELLRRLV